MDLEITQCFGLEGSLLFTGGFKCFSKNLRGYYNIQMC